MKVGPLHSALDSPASTETAGQGADEADYHRLLQTTRWKVCGRTLRLLALDHGGAPENVFSRLSRTSLGQHWLDLVCPLDLDRVQMFLSAPTGRPPIDYRLVLPDGELLWIRHWMISRGEGPVGPAPLTGLLQAISEQKHLESECLRISEQERGRIGQELHDDICQVLAGLSYMMRILARRMATSEAEVQRELNELNECLTGAMNRTRAMAHGLFPAQLADGTLRHALHELAEQMKTRFQFEIALALPPRIPPHSTEQITHIYRIAQEAVSNAVRHGGATRMEIGLRQVGPRFELVLDDDGRGFSHETHTPGIGLHAMRHRAQLLGGVIEFGNRPGGGAFIRLVYSLNRGVRRTAQAA